MIDDATGDISKSQRKRDARALFELGRALVGLPQALLERVELPVPVREAVDRARETRPRIAHKRELQRLAKVLRQSDEAEAIAGSLEAVRRPDRDEVRRLHRLEGWRDRLLADGDSALAELREERPDLDPQPVRQLLRQARREASGLKPPRAARRLFKLLGELDAAEPLP